MLPSATPALYSSLWKPSRRSASRSIAAACAGVLPVTSGTVTVEGPVPTVIVTSYPTSTRFPPPGFWLTTSPSSPDELSRSCVLTLKPAPSSSCSAAARAAPMTLGTPATCVPTTTTSMVEPLSASPPLGSCLRMVSTGRSPLTMSATSRSKSSPYWSSASSRVMPTRLGTAIFGIFFSGDASTRGSSPSIR